mmetsp:Transcript_33227/g.56869  ORF Transcript_33227/g.56869 Transcript_33227/m.56869 type:complete len:95 (+) Transcript_33227:256-540(+)
MTPFGQQHENNIKIHPSPNFSKRNAQFYPALLTIVLRLTSFHRNHSFFTLSFDQLLPPCSYATVSSSVHSPNNTLRIGRNSAPLLPSWRFNFTH